MLLVINLQKSFINENTKELPTKIQNFLNKNMLDDVVFANL